MNENSPQILNSDKIIDFLNEVFNRIQEKYNEIKGKREQLKYEKEVKSIMNLMEEIEELIDIDPSFTEIELFDFMDIKEMTEYILKDKDLFEEHFNFICESLMDYTNITLLKSEPQGKPYEEEYERFEYGLNRKKEFFYTHIYEHLGIYDDLIDEVVDILWGDEY